VLRDAHGRRTGRAARRPPRKLAGAPSGRETAPLLQHGSILVEDDQSAIGALAAVALPPVPAPATLRRALGRAPDVSEVAAALFAAAPCLGGGDAGPAAVAPLTAADRAALHADAAVRRAHYADPAWTWRR
jgi:hypothetical protein